VLVIALLFVRDLNAIYGIFFLLSTVSSFYIPAQTVAIRTLAPAGGLMSVNALMSQAMQASQIVSPAVSGLMVEALGANSCFLFDVLSFFFSAWMVASLPIRRTSAPPRQASVLRSMGDGFRFIFTHSVISFVMIAMSTGMFAVRCFGTLLSVYVRDVLQSNARALRHAEFADRLRHDRRNPVRSAHCDAQSLRSIWCSTAWPAWAPPCLSPR
jgi:hypothetical protein